MTNNYSLEEKNARDHSTNKKSIMQKILNVCTIVLTFSAVLGLIVTLWQFMPITETYTVTFDPNGGNGGIVEQKFVAKNGVGKTQWLYGGTPTRIGYTFVCWNIKSGGSGEDLHNGAEITTNGDFTLYAVWMPIIVKYTVIFDPNGGIGGNGSQVFIGAPTDSEEKVVLGVFNGGTPTRSGYTFQYWNLERDGSGARKYFNGETLTITADCTVYAIWKK